jgi:hypothetical protein
VDDQGGRSKDKLEGQIWFAAVLFVVTTVRTLLTTQINFRFRGFRLTPPEDGRITETCSG